ncbi:MAG: hypothetical protein C4589_01465 [Peptococcaceae bacterium]|nr:MAG: hypothetical protein C4589_01465 [Peptococcaceae bacterium]
MVNKISIQVELGLRAIEKKDVIIYLDGEIADFFRDVEYEDIHAIAGELRSKYPEAEVEITCTGEDCCGRAHTWKIDA